MGDTPREGFEYLLRNLARRIGLAGEVRGGRGVFSAGGHPVVVTPIQGGARVLTYSNVLFPPYGIPREVARALADWPLPYGWMSFDGETTDRQSRLLLRAAICATGLDAEMLRETIDLSLSQVKKLDYHLRQSGYDRPPLLEGRGASGHARPASPLSWGLTAVADFLGLPAPRRK
jgi:hypothetical protein